MPNKRLALSILLFSAFALAAPPTPVDAGKTTANVFESSFFNFRYEFPKGWFALDDNARVAGNQKRYDSAQQEARANEDPNSPLIAPVTVPYDLLLASRSSVASSDAKPLPRVVIRVNKRSMMMSEPGDPAALIIKLRHPKVLRGPEDTVIAGHKFVRTDFEYPDSLDSKFVTTSDTYLLEFDLRAENEKDLADLVATLQTIKFSEQ